MISRKAIISVLVLCLMFCLCLPCLPWTSLWVCVIPGSCPPLPFICRRWLRSRKAPNATRDWSHTSSQGLIPRIPWFTWATPVKVALVLPSFSSTNHCKQISVSPQDLWTSLVKRYHLAWSLETPMSLLAQTLCSATWFWLQQGTSLYMKSSDKSNPPLLCLVCGSAWPTLPSLFLIWTSPAPASSLCYFN